MCGFRGIKAWVSGWGEVGQASEAQLWPSILQAAVATVPTDSKCPFVPVLASPQGPHVQESSPGSGRIWSL